MTPPTGFRTKTATTPRGPLAEIRPAAAIEETIGPAVVASSSSAADYAYRIAALTAGLAFLATFV